MQEYHYNWLSTHKHRTEEWLKAKLLEGFDIHHIDGNHSNNEPSNLVLIEHTDHMRLHGMGDTSIGRLNNGPKPRVRLSLEEQDTLYAMYMAYVSNKDIAAHMGLSVVNQVTEEINAYIDSGRGAKRPRKTKLKKAKKPKHVPVEALPIVPVDREKQTFVHNGKAYTY